MNDPRALAFIVFQKIKRELAGQDQDEELSPRRAREIILDALQLLPEISVRPGPRDGLVLIRLLDDSDETGEQTEGQKEFLFNLQDFVDSLRTVWRDFRDQMKRTDQASSPQARTKDSNE